MKQDLVIFKQHVTKRVENAFILYIAKTGDGADSLKDAMRYSLLNGGKRLRPLLVYATASALNIKYEDVDAAAFAIEAIHAYSLIHDDLPAMDNADLRRGKPSCHKAYNEALAILAGDALQTLAFDLLANHPCSLNSEQRLSMIKLLSSASGANGMCAGQAIDIANSAHNAESLTQMYALKTGALLNAAVLMACAAAENLDPVHFQHLKEYADCLGLAFQIQDDLLDIEGTTLAIGKPQGIDTLLDKTTYPKILGVTAAKAKVQELLQTALLHLESLGKKGNLLRNLTIELVERKQ